MPLPLIPIAAWGTFTVLSSAGIWKAVEGFMAKSDAKKIRAEAQEIIVAAQESTKPALDKCTNSLELLGATKFNVLNGSISRFINVYDKIKNVELSDSPGLQEMHQFRIDEKELIDLDNLVKFAAETMGAGVAGVGTGALIAFGSYGATMTFASASTGTAIASLSGVAATKATLAWLGGGAIAAGGWGVAGGMAVLGGLVAGPALAVFGIIMDAQAKKEFEEALSNKAEAEKIAKKLKSTTIHCTGVAKRADMFSALLGKLDNVLTTLTSQLEYIVSTRGANYSKYSEEEQNRVAMARSVAGAIKSVLDTPILCKDGSISDESLSTNTAMSLYVDEVESLLA